MAIPERDTVYTTETPNRVTYTRESSATGWFVGIIVALALLAIGYLVYSASSGPAPSNTTINNTPAIESPAPVDNSTQPTTDTTPMMQSAPATDSAPAIDNAPATTAPADQSVAPADQTPAPVDAPAPASQ